MSKYLITITGPSGSGKTELLNELCKLGMYTKLLSVTSRPMRPGEQDGVDYHFTSNPFFEKVLSEGDKFVQTVKFQGNFYGTLKAEAEEVVNSDKIPIVIVEPTGIPQFEKFCEDRGFTIFKIFMSANLEILIHRYLPRIKPADFEDPDRMAYHAKRISGIHTELEWRDANEFDCVFYNSGNDLRYVTEMATMVGNYISRKNKE